MKDGRTLEDEGGGRGGGGDIEEGMKQVAITPKSNNTKPSIVNNNNENNHPAPAPAKTTTNVTGMFNWSTVKKPTESVHSGSSKSHIKDLMTDPQDKDINEEDHGNNAHGAHDNPPTALSLLSSAIVCFIIYFVFSIVFSSVVWDPLNSALDTTIDPPFGVPQGVGINLLGIAVGSVFFAIKSGCKGMISGPDLLPVVFFAEAGGSVLMYLVGMSGDPPCSYYDDSGSDGDHHRLLGAASKGDTYGDTTSPCTEDSDMYHRHLAGESTYIDPKLIPQHVPTTLLAMMIGNAITALLFYGLGKMKNTASVIGFIPASVVAGFLTCIGYKVIKLAVLITTGYSFKEKYIRELGQDYWHENDPWLPLFIALIYGCLLYGLKHKHVVPAEKLIMAFITVPLILFFAICGIKGVDMNYLRETDWFLTQARDGNGCTQYCAFTRTNFWQTLEVVYGGLFTSNLIAWGAIPRCLPIFFMGSCMTSLDSMLKLTSSEKALGIDLDYNHEMKLGGKATIVSSVLAGSPAYGQTKFNVMNLSIARTAESNLPTLYLGALCLLVFLSGLAGPIINIMPRFLLGGLCVFAGVGFLWENLVEGRHNMNRVSFAIVWIIFLVNFIWEFFVLQNLPKEIQPMVPGLLVVFILGIVLSTFEFMFAFMHKAKPPVIRNGDECCSSAIRSEKHDNQLAVMSPWFQVFAVESFVFFGTANNLYQQLKGHLADQKVTKPKAERTKYIIFDLAQVTGIDSSAKNVFFKAHRLLKTEGIKLVWAMAKPKLVNHFDQWGLYEGTKRFDSLDLALRHVEDQLLRRAHHLSSKWLVNSTVRRIFERQVLANVFNISVRSNEKNVSSARLQPWSERVTIAAGKELCGCKDDNLYMLYSGEVQIQGRDGLFSVFTGSFFNTDRLLISIGALPGLPSTLGAVATEDSMVLVLSSKQFMAMSKEDGALAQKLLMTLICQSEGNRPGRVRVRAVRNQLALTEKLDESRRSANGNERRDVASRLLAGDDYQISLTDSQIERFGQIFELILEPGQDEVPLERFSHYVSLEAHALGSQIEHKQFMAMIDASGIDEDGDGSLSKDEFLSFLRGLFLADIPSAEVGVLREAYDAAVAEAADEPMDEARTQVLFGSLGFDVESSGWHDVMGVIDADGDGDVDFNEFLTGIGMMKQFCILSHQLEGAFVHYKSSAQERRRASIEIDNDGEHQIHRGVSGVLASFTSLGKSLIPQDHDNQGQFPGEEKKEEVEEKKEEVELDAIDLKAFLGISLECAEEMVFLADQDEVEAVQQGPSEEVKADRTIVRDEFQQLIRSWS